MFPAAYGTAAFAQASPMASPLGDGVDTGSATQRKATALDELDAPAEDMNEDPAAAALLRLFTMADLFGGAR